MAILMSGWMAMNMNLGMELEMNRIQQLASRFGNDIKGVTALEYGMIAALITVVLLSGFATLGNKLSTTLSTISNTFPAG